MKLFNFKSDMHHYAAPGVFGAVGDGGAFDPSFWQGETNRCAVYAQYAVLKDFGFDGDIDYLVDEATRRGWFSESGGTPVECVGRLLESNGVPCDVYFNANKYNLVDALAHGKRVIVTVDAGELWAHSDEERLLEGLEDVVSPNADHALLVSGIDVRDPENPLVVLSDSGTGQRAVSYPLAQFEDAWADGSSMMVVTRDPAPLAFNGETMANFDYGVGHIPFVAPDVGFDEWQTFHADELQTAFEDVPSDALAAAFAEGELCDIADAADAVDVVEVADAVDSIDTVDAVDLVDAVEVADVADVADAVDLTDAADVVDAVDVTDVSSSILDGALSGIGDAVETVADWLA